MRYTDDMTATKHFLPAAKGIAKACSLLVAFLLWGNLSYSQVYPVQATVQLSPPYSLYLADYVESGSERLALNVFLSDIARPDLNVRFRLKIIGQGISLETKAEYLPPPVSIQGGVPLRLTSADLADYFHPNNLTFQGMSARQYAQRGKLPEGVYQFCFEVLEYNRGLKISNTSCAVAWLVLNDPPIVNLPRQNEKLKAQSVQNVVFQWTPRHTGSPNSAFTTEYEIRMVEVWPDSRNPNDAILTSPPILEETTRNTTFIYGPAETPLEPGRRYAFRIRAKSIAGVDELDLFKNQGYSEVVTFVYGDACDLPTGISAHSVSSSRFTLGWEPLFNHTAFKVRYREQGTQDWYENNVTLSSTDVYGLKGSTTYEYQVASTCGFFDGDYSPIATVTTAEEVPVAYSCGVPVTPFNLDPAQLTGSLKPGDVIHAGDFEVTLVTVNGSNGIFSGEGVVEVPYLNAAKVKTSFTNITVNKQLRMVNGFMDVTGAAVDVVPQGVMDAVEELSETLDVIDSALTTVEENLPDQVDWTSFVPDTLIVIPGEIASVAKNDDGSVSVTDTQGNTRTLPAGANTAVTDAAGNGYLVDKNGNIHKTTSDAATKLANREYNLIVRFGQDRESRYGFDISEFNPPSDEETLADGYQVAWKSVASGASEPVVAIVDASDIDESKIRFESGGIPVSTAPFGSDHMARISIAGGSDGSFEDLLALYTPTDSSKEQVLGKLKVVSYDEIKHKVIIVPVNDALLPAGLTRANIEDSLNAIYRQAVVNWEVEIEPAISVSLADPFDDGGTGLLSNYTEDMKKVIRAYGTLDDDKYYLFLVSNPASGLLGYMPRGKQAGFIFPDQHPSASDVVRTLAHELGHGAFHLHHTFEEPNFPITRGTTDNLMDYPAGNKLYKFQWDKMRYPDIVIGLFEEDEDAQLMAALMEIASKDAEPSSDCFNTSSYLAPNGRPIDYMASGITALYIAKYTSDAPKYFINALVDKSGVRYFADYEDDVFTGYKSKGKTFPLVYKEAPASIQVKVALDYGDRCYYKFHCISDWSVPPASTKVSDIIKLIEEKTAGDAGSGRPWRGRTTESPECQSLLYVLDATNRALPGDVYKKLDELFNGSRQNRLTGEAIRIKGKLILTSSDPTLNQKSVEIRKEGEKDVLYFNGAAVDVPADEILFWLEAQGSKILVKRIIFGAYADEGIQNSLAVWESNIIWDQKSFWEKAGTVGYQAIDGYFTALYDLTDLLSSGIGKLKLPKSVYDCQSVDENGKPDYNPWYAHVFSFVNVTALVNDLVFDQLKQKYPELNNLPGEPSQIQFAFFCGMYNGLIEVVESVPAFVNLLITPLSSKGRENAMEQFSQFAEIEISTLNEDGTVETVVCSKDEYMCKVFELVKEGLVKMFDPNTPCAAAHNIGSIVGPIIVTCMGDAAAAESVLAKVASTTLQVLKWCDKFTDIFLYLKASTRIVKTVGGKLLLQVRNTGGNLVEQLENGKFRLTIYIESAISPSYVDVPEAQMMQVMSAGAGGGMVNMSLDGLPSQPFSLFSPVKAWDEAFENLARNIGISAELLMRFKNAGVVESTVKDMVATYGNVRLERLITLFENLPFKDAASIRVLAQDITASSSLSQMVKGGAFDVNAWKVLHENGSKLVRQSADELARFAKLTPEAQRYVAMFADAKSPSTLQKFLTAVNDNPAFLGFVNDPGNDRFIRGFLNHKLTPAEIQDIGELLAEDGLSDLTREWLERSQGFANFNRYKELGRKLSENITASLRSRSGALYEALKAKLNLGVDANGTSILDQYEMFTEVPLTTSGGFMKADIMLVKQHPRTGKIEDILIIENKLSKATSYTDRQKEAFKRIGQKAVVKMSVHYEVRGPIVGGGFEQGTILEIARDKCFKISDHGSDNIDGLTAGDIQLIDYSKL